jgi:hypothetical protein
MKLPSKTQLFTISFVCGSLILLGCTSSTPTGPKEPNEKQLSKEKMEPEKGSGGKKG